MTKTLKPELIDSQTPFTGYVDLKVDRVKKGSLEGSFTYISPKSNAVCILARTPEGKWILVEEYRHPIGSYLLALPGGAMEKGESPLITAERELFEETGYKGKELQLLGSLPPLPALCSQTIHFVLALDASPISSPLLEPFEFIHPVLLTSKEVETRIHQTTDVDGILCTCWLLKNIYFTRMKID